MLPPFAAAGNTDGLIFRAVSAAVAGSPPPGGPPGGPGGTWASSNAPMSQAIPWGRRTPRWSVLGGGQPGLPASTAGLPAVRAWVSVGPPLFASGPSPGSVFGRSPAAWKLHSSRLSMLCPVEGIDDGGVELPTTEQLRPALAIPLATIESLTSNVVPGNARRLPPRGVAAEPVAVLPLMVVDRSVHVLSFELMPPPATAFVLSPAMLPAIVLLVMVPVAMLPLIPPPIPLVERLPVMVLLITVRVPAWIERPAPEE